MVFVDLTDSNDFEKDSFYNAKLASPSDRLLAFFIDFVITSPVASLLAARSLRDIKENVINNSSVEEIAFSVVSYLVIFFLVNVVIQVFMLHYWNSSLGQKILKLKVVRFPSDQMIQPLTLVQCLTRAVGPWLSLLALGIPTLEMFSHPFRRTFYDRLSDTLVITTKNQGVGAPHAFEARFVRQWMQLVSFIIGFAVLGQFVLMLKEEKDNSLQISGQQKPGCPDVNLFSNHKHTRLDRALALYLVSPEEFSCLQKELDNARIFTKEAGLAYLAKSLLEKDDNLIKKYQNKVCEVDAKSMECAWIKKSTELKTSSSLALQVLQVNEHVKAKNWSLALEQIEPLLAEEMLFSGLQKKYVKSYFSWLKPTDRKNDRQPASVKNIKITEKFKKYYGVE